MPCLTNHHQLTTVGIEEIAQSLSLGRAAIDRQQRFATTGIERFGQQLYVDQRREILVEVGAACGPSNVPCSISRTRASVVCEHTDASARMAGIA
jgi:hypothetical protein